MAKERPPLDLGPHPWPECIKEARLKLNLSEREVAVRAGTGVTEQTIQRMEAGDGQVEVSTFLQVCAALGTHPAVILDREVDPGKIRQREMEQGRTQYGDKRDAEP